MASVTYENVSKHFGDVVAVSDLNLVIPDKEFLVLLGPSGCGKTTTLRCLAGLEEISEGNIYIEDRLVNDVPPKDRDIAMVFQSYALYPHMTVYNNMAFGLKLRKTPKADIERRVKEAATILHIEELLDRKPKQLSGGQRQRVGVARALAADPAIVLMDEPFGALDPITRDQLQTEFMDLEDRLKKTVLFVTHDIFEAVKLGDRIALLDAGQLQQIGTPAEIVESPANEFVDQFLGEHRFQLSLLTRTVRQLAEPGEEPPPEERKPRALESHSIIEALDAFKRTSRQRIPVYDEHGCYRGNVRRRRVFEAIADAVGHGNGEGEEGSTE